MSGYSYLTKKQAGIVYAATKRGDVTADKRFIRKMYDLVGIRWMDLDPKERAIVIHAEQAVDHIMNGRLELAQAELDGRYTEQVWVITSVEKVIVTEENIDAIDDLFAEIGEESEIKHGEWTWKICENE